MSEWALNIDDRDYGDENDFNEWVDNKYEDEFYLDEDEDDNINLGGALVPNNPYPNSPSRGDTLVIEKELVLA